MYSPTGTGDTQAAFSEASATLSNFNRNELQKLMDDTAALDEIIDDFSVVKKLRDKESLLVSNASLAEYNLSLEPKLISARQELADVYKRAVELQKQHERNMLLLESHAVNTSPETTLAVLQTELAKVEEESEKIAERFSASGSGSDVEAFLEKYVNLRVLAHLRRIKVDKLTELLREPPQQQQHREVAATVAALATGPPVPARSTPHAAPTAQYPPPPVAGATSGWGPHYPYPPIGNSNGWPAYTGAVPYAQPVPYMPR